jgi:fucose permease
MSAASRDRTSSVGLIKGLTYLMFTMFAMTTDSVGKIIPEVIREFRLSQTAAGAFHYAPMIAIALAGILLGHLADRLGRKRSVLLGLTLFALNSYLFAVGSSFAVFLLLLSVSGAAIGIFKTGALALVGDITRSTTEHTSTMNLVEGFFGVGAILGPAIVTGLLGHGVAWKWLYVIAGSLCVLLIVTALLVRYPRTARRSEEPVSLGRTLRMMRNGYALAFSLGAFLYVAVECAVYVWMPTLVADYGAIARATGATLPSFLAAYGISIFFALRAAGRFLGGWVLARYDWTAVLCLFSLAILLCFLGSVLGGIGAALYLLPLSGLFMSMLYPTINSKGISCFPKAQHGAVAGVILFFSCGAAALGPLAMGAVGDAGGSIGWGFVLATGLAALLFLGALVNYVRQPARALLEELDRSEYAVTGREAA